MKKNQRHEIGRGFVLGHAPSLEGRLCLHSRTHGCGRDCVNHNRTHHCGRQLCLTQSNPPLWVAVVLTTVEPTTVAAAVFNTIVPSHCGQLLGKKKKNYKFFPEHETCGFF